MGGEWWVEKSMQCLKVFSYLSYVYMRPSWYYLICLFESVSSFRSLLFLPICLSVRACAGLSVSGVLLGSASAEHLPSHSPTPPEPNGTHGANPHKSVMAKDNSCPAAVNPSNVSEKSKAEVAAKGLK